MRRSGIFEATKGTTTLCGMPTSGRTRMRRLSGSGVQPSSTRLSNSSEPLFGVVPCSISEPEMGSPPTRLLCLALARVVPPDRDPSDDIGIRALQSLTGRLAVIPLIGVGEQIPLRDLSVDLVYVRQVLHHASDLPLLVSECARVLKRGGVLLVCREHVVDDERQLDEFLRDHPVHQLAGGENAFCLPEYLQAIEASGLQVQRVLRPWDSVINAFPVVRTNDELREFPTTLLKRKLGLAGELISRLVGVRQSSSFT